MAINVVMRRDLIIHLACEILGMSQSCYCYRHNLSEDSKRVADRLIGLTHNRSKWGVGLCFNRWSCLRQSTNG